MKARKKRVPTRDEMLMRMASLCASSEQCAYDIRNKIFRAGLDAADADSILEYLANHRYVDDSRFARSFASYKVRFAGWGRIKIRVHLKAKRIEDKDIMAALNAIDPADYADALRKALASKARSADPRDRDGRAALYRNLASRGFESDMIVAEIKRYVAGLD